MRLRRTATAAFLAGLAVLAVAPSAAAFSIDDPAVVTGTDQAGANTDVTISFDVGEPSADLRDLTVHLPPGLVGNPLAAPQCTEAQLNAQACPPDSVVGTVSNDVNVTVGLTVPQTVSGQLFNMVPQPGEPARFGIVLSATPLPPPLNTFVLPPIILQSPAQLRQSDLGLDSVLTDLPNTAEVALGTEADIDITGVDLTLNGQAGDPPQGFIRLPTSCKEHTVGFTAVSYGDEQAEASATFTTTGCPDVPFSPELTASGIPQGLGKPMELTTTITQTIEEAGLARAEVILPRGLTGNNDLLGTLCPREDFFAGSCPPETIVGQARAASPLQSEALTGPVSLVEPATPALPDVGLDLRGPLALKLTGNLTLDPATGRAVTTFPTLPDIPIADFTLTFSREPGLVFAGVDPCAAEALIVDARFVAHSGAEVTTEAPIELRGCGRGAKPRASLRLSRERTNRPRLTFTARAGARSLRAARLKLPRALRLAKKAKLARKAKIEADGEALKRRNIGRRKRVLTLRAGSAERLRAKLGKGTLRRSGKVRKRAKFGVVLTDRSGDKTRLKLRAK